MFETAPGEYEILWDKWGNPYIVTDGKVLFTKERCAIDAYEMQPLHEVRKS